MPDAVPGHSDDCAIVITGFGLTTCLGIDAETTWRSILAGTSGMGPMPGIESVLPPGSIGGQAADLPAAFHPDLPREARYLRWTVEHAMRNASLDTRSAIDSSRRAVVLGTTLHGIRAGGRFLRTDHAAELKSFLAGATASLALDGLGLHGGTLTTCSACSSSLGAIIQGAMLLRAGQADIVIAGGYDAISEYAWSGFNALRLVAQGPLRPFCRDRQGMKIAEGYGIVILERAEDAAARKAPIAAILAGWGESADAHHLTQPHPQGDGALSAMQSAAARAGIEPQDLGMIAAHATGTPDNDASEYQALSRLLGANLPRVPIVGFKSHLGHTLGGAGAVELVLSALALRDQVVPSCANIASDEVEFSNLNVSTGAARPRDLLHTLNTSLGFGGANTCVVLKRAARPATTPAAIRAHPRPTIQLEAWITGIGILLPGCIGNAAFLEQAIRPAHPLPSDVPDVLNDASLAPHLNARRVRRLSPYVKYTLAAASLALRDAGLNDRPDIVASASALLGSMHGSPTFCSDYYTQIVQEGALAANPVLFAEGVPNVAAAHLSATFGVLGPCQSIIGTRTSGLDALALAALRIQSGESETVIVVAAEEQHPIIDRAYRELGLAKSPSGGFRSTHGAIALIVESSTSAAARGTRPYARIDSSALASRGTASTPRSIASVLRLLGSPMHVIGSACGTWVDRAEARGVHRSHKSAVIGSTHDRFGELFAATPLLGIADLLATGSLRTTDANTTPEPVTQFVSLCTDWTGAAAAVKLHRLDRRLTESP